MKLKIASAALLLVCFSLLVIPSGAIPVFLQGSEETSPEAALTLPADTPPPPSDEAETPAPTSTPIPSTEEISADNAAPILPAEETDAPSESVRLISTTIRADEPLDNETEYELDAASLINDAPDIDIPSDGYQVLILHTHSTEAYTPEIPGQYIETDAYRTTDPDYSVIRVGEELASALENCGLHVLHDTTVYDYPSYNGSYERSGTTASEYLAAYPSIRLVIDLHRDALCDDEVMYRTIADIDGTEAAQLMFVMGSDVNLEHPLWRQNLQLALTLQSAVDEQYPSLMRSTLLCRYRYNQQLCPGYLLLEVGTSGNTLTEAIHGVQLFAEAAGPLIASWVDE